MGLESANYLLVPNGGVEGAAEALAECGASKRSQFPAGGFDRWVLKNERYWIDVMLGDFGPNDRKAISVRLALCNPSDVHQVLRQLLTTLLEHVPGSVLDKQTGQSFTVLSEDNWRSVLTGLQNKRDQFQEYFGPIEAAISGDDVFTELNRLEGRKTGDLEGNER